MQVYDISLPISESSVVWPGDPSPQFTLLSNLNQGDNSTVTQLTMSAHTGTHVDAPRHFIAGGPGVDKLDLDALVGPSLVVDTGSAKLLTASVLNALNVPAGTERVLFKTSNSELWAYGEKTFYREFVALSLDGAQWLVRRQVKLVGIDYLSVAPYGNTRPTHQALLAAGIVLLEGLNLNGIKQGVYQLYCLPLKIKGCDGAPARAILIR
ncbi:MAG: cyclase family protein [Anaerolineae bacterium]|nr:cyclase family protein [Anaerolineae bacterium]